MYKISKIQKKFEKIRKNWKKLKISKKSTTVQSRFTLWLYKMTNMERYIIFYYRLRRKRVTFLVSAGCEERDALWLEIHVWHSRSFQGCSRAPNRDCGFDNIMTSAHCYSNYLYLFNLSLMWIQLIWNVIHKFDLLSLKLLGLSSK